MVQKLLHLCQAGPLLYRPHSIHLSAAVGRYLQAARQAISSRSAFDITVDSLPRAVGIGVKPPLENPDTTGFPVTAVQQVTGQADHAPLPRFFLPDGKLFLYPVGLQGQHVPDPQAGIQGNLAGQPVRLGQQ